jgi:hypothetical protein
VAIGLIWNTISGPEQEVGSLLTGPPQQGYEGA